MIIFFLYIFNSILVGLTLDHSNQELLRPFDESQSIPKFFPFLSNAVENLTDFQRCNTLLRKLCVKNKTARNALENNKDKTLIISVNEVVVVCIIIIKSIAMESFDTSADFLLRLMEAVLKKKGNINIHH